MSDKAKAPVTGVKIVKSQFDTYLDPIYSQRIEKSDKSEQLDESVNISSSDWIPHWIDMAGLEAMVQHSTILPQCIRAYKNNIAGFGIAVKYRDDIEETEATKTEWDALERIIDLLNLDKDTKEVFEQIVESRETYGIGYVEVIRNLEGDVVEIDFIKDTPTIEMTYPLEPYVDVEYAYREEVISRKKKFRKFRQIVGGKTVYFKEFGDPRIMDKRYGTYIKDGEELELEYQANEILDFAVGNEYYGCPRWIGQSVTVDGNFRAEKLNNNYFRNGRHTPLMIMIQGGTLSDESFDKLQGYMNEIKGENGQHAFIILETEKNETTTDFADDKQPTIQVKDLAGILQTDGLFQEYQEKGRKKVQSSFLLPDLYVGYTTDFNRATAQTAMEITEKQVFQPERISLAWQINNKLLNGYGFKYVEAYFEAPDITNPDDIFKLLNIAEKAGGLTLNDARTLAMDTLGKESEDYPDTFNMEDIGNVPLAVINALNALKNYGYEEPEQNVTTVSQPNKVESGDISEESKQVDQNLDSTTSEKSTEQQLIQQIDKAESNHDDEIVAVMKEVRKQLIRMGGGDDEV